MLMWKWIGTNEKQIKIVFAIIAAMYIGFEYRAKVKQDKIARAISYVEKHEQEKILEAREHLRGFWLTGPVKELRERLKSSIPPEKRPEQYHKEMVALLHSSGRIAEVNSLLSFYGSVALCVNISHCDDKTVCRYFFDEIQRFRENYRALLDQWADELGDLTPREIKHLAESTCSQQFKLYCKELKTSPYCSSRTSQ
jgi:hypothetical protein